MKNMKIKSGSYSQHRIIKMFVKPNNPFEISGAYLNDSFNRIAEILSDSIPGNITILSNASIHCIRFILGNITGVKPDHIPRNLNFLT